MASFNQKLRISAGSAALFAFINLPFVYKLTNNISGLDLYNQASKCPTHLGLLVHTLVFFSISYFSMSGVARTGIKLKHSFYGALIFFLVANPVTFKFVASILGKGIADSNGCPTLFGLLIHAIVYCALLVGVMYFPEGNK